ncbi:ras-related protein Rab-32B isoform X3 [Octopus bimaculoides]|uniref:ras-related protein Rab-32B isoform X3 n=1 Tax=Octopus bimaculoides TaxID=37653 RepID=UPI0022E02E38|nr:ras-related protein Rab-32B isoform X3 [Octopus bimaculoides]
MKNQEGKSVSQTSSEQTIPLEERLHEDKSVTQAVFQHNLPNKEPTLDIGKKEKPFYGAATIEASYEGEIKKRKEVEALANAEVPSSKMSPHNERGYSELQSPQESSPQDAEEFQSQIRPSTLEQVSPREYFNDKNAICDEGVMDAVQTMQQKSDAEIESLEKEIENLTSLPIRILHKPKDTNRYTPVDESYSSSSEEEESPTKHNYSKEISSDQRENSKTSGIEKKEHLYKILVIGELGTGKTSIIKRYVHQFFSQHYRATIGVDFALKVISWDADTLIRLQLWDIAGQERFGNMTRVYYKEAVGAFVVFDVTRVPTFEAVVKWKNDLDSKVQLPDGSNIPCVLLANKCDQTKEGLVNNTEQMDDFCKEKGFLSWFETSAKENINIDEAARFLVGQILKNDQNMNTGSTEEDKERIQLANANQQEPTKKSCCR